jgi:Flp pilus assembly pilin Flp
MMLVKPGSQRQEHEEKRMNIWKGLWKEEEGQDLVEYALLIALIALVAASTFPKLASAVSDVLSDAIVSLQNGGTIIIRP